MLRHVVLLRFREGTSADVIEEIIAGLRELPRRIEDVRQFDCGRDVGLGLGNAHLAIVADFDDSDAYERYAAHPVHVTFVTEKILPVLSERTAVQFTVGSDTG